MMQSSGKTFGQYIKALRLEQQLSLRAFCEKHDLDPGNLSRIERGKQTPKADALKQYLGPLGVADGTDESQEFFDLAAAARHELPADLQDDEIAAKLPVLFRTLRRFKYAAI